MLGPRLREVVLSKRIAVDATVAQLKDEGRRYLRKLQRGGEEAYIM